VVFPVVEPKKIRRRSFPFPDGAGAAPHPVSSGTGRIEGGRQETDLFRGKRLAEFQLVDNHPLLDFGFQF